MWPGTSKWVESNMLGKSFSDIILFLVMIPNMPWLWFSKAELSLNMSVFNLFKSSLFLVWLSADFVMLCQWQSHTCMYWWQIQSNEPNFSLQLIPWTFSCCHSNFYLQNDPTLCWPLGVMLELDHMLWAACIVRCPCWELVGWFGCKWPL